MASSANFSARSNMFPVEGTLDDIRWMPSRAIKELEKCFEATNVLEDKQLQFLGWRGPDKAVKTIKKYAV